ncbi:MAG: tRNA lysidine(34) synthetase TilS [Lachnospiraceae bacterium]|nr:tRNA lysidine(34) synthetase TilS [Lachnospiraceae bacterium]
MDALTLEIKRYIENNQLIRPGDGVVVGLSGGPDSVFLLYALHTLQARMGFTLRAVHVHHGIRGAEADRDAAFSEELCAKLEIPFQAVHVAAPAYAAQRGLSLEEGARILRYEALETVRQQLTTPAAWVAVAHHLDDQAETVLHNLVRGAGLRGLAGMENRRNHVIRPLLSIKREDILKWLEQNKIAYVTDSMNADPHYTRNRIRSTVLPELREINPEASAHIAHSAALLREADAYFHALALRYVDAHATLTASPVPLPETDTPGESTIPRPSALAEDRVEGETEAPAEAMILRSIALPVTELKAYPELVRQYVYSELLRRIGTPLKDWSAVHYRDIDRLIFGPGGAHLDLPYRMSAEYRKKTLILQENREVISVKRRKNHG